MKREVVVSIVLVVAVVAFIFIVNNFGDEIGLSPFQQASLSGSSRLESAGEVFAIVDGELQKSDTPGYFNSISNELDDDEFQGLEKLPNSWILVYPEIDPVIKFQEKRGGSKSFSLQQIKTQENLILERTNLVRQEVKAISGASVARDYTKVLSGSVVEGVSENEVKKIASSVGAEYYPNLIVRTNLPESVSMINADKVWFNDDQGNVCDAEYTGECSGGGGQSRCEPGEVCVSQIPKVAEIVSEDFFGGEVPSLSPYCGSCDIVGDVNGDYRVGREDLEFVESNVGTSNSNADIDGDGDVDYNDYYLVSANFGESCDSVSSCIRGNEVTIGIIDTGVDYTHIDLGGCFGEGCKVAGGYDFVNGDPDPMDDHGHGTHVAATAAGDGILKGVAPNANIYAYKVLNSGGSGSFAGIISAIERSVDPNQDGDTSDHLDIISLSLGANCGEYSEFCGPDDPQSMAIDAATQAGVVAVVAAGNSGESSIGSPGTARGAITVAAACKPEDVGVNGFCTDNIATFSSWGPTNVGLKPDVAAPGVDICAAQYNGWREGISECDPELEGHIAISGTSMATPHVSGIVALLLEKDSSLNPKEIKDILIGSAEGLGTSMVRQGYGLVNAEKIFEISRPPLAELDISGDFTNSEIVNVIGSAEGRYFVEMVHVNDLTSGPSLWTEVCSGQGDKYNDLLCSFNFGDYLAEGNYFLRLVVRSDNPQDLPSTGYASTVISKKEAEISHPVDLNTEEYYEEKEIFSSKRTNPIKVIGTAAGAHFSHYSIDFCDYYGPLPCKGMPERVSGVNPTQSVQEDVLAEIDLLGLERGYYRIVLRVFRNDSNPQAVVTPSIVTSSIYVEDRFHEGYPVDFRSLSTIPEDFWVPSIVDMPTIADIEGDGSNELIFAYGTQISVLDSEGNHKSFSPINIQHTSCWWEPGTMQIGPAFSDLDNDGRLEWAVGDNCGYLHVFDDDGSYLNENWPKKFGSYIDGVSIADIDRDGQKDIIFSDWWASTYVVDQQGNHLPGWPHYGYSDPQPTFPSAIGDIDEDGFLEIVVPYYSGEVSIFNHDGTFASVDWPLELGDSNVDFATSIAIADIDGNGELELIAANDGSIFILEANLIQNTIWFIPEAQHSVYGGSQAEITLGDVDKDGSLDIILQKDDEDKLLVVIDNQGNLKPGFPVLTGSPSCSNFGGHLHMGDIEGDSSLEIVPAEVARGPRVQGDPLRYKYRYHLTDEGLGPLDPFRINSGYCTSGSQITDLDGDGDNEIVFGPANFALPPYVFVWDTEGSSATNDVDWTTFHYNQEHTRCYQCDN